MDTYGGVTAEQYAEIVIEAILRDQPNDDTRADLHMGAIKRLADYCYYQGYDFEDVGDICSYGTYDILKYTLDEIAEEIEQTSIRSAENWRKISGI